MTPSKPPKDKTGGGDGGSSTDAKQVALAKMGAMHDKLQEMLTKDDPLPPLLDRPDLKPRAAAAMIDGFAAAAVVFLFSIAGIFMGYVMLNLMMMVGAVVASAFMLARDGLYKSASPGKHAVGIRVVDEDGHFIGIITSAKRNLLPALPYLTVVVYCLLNIVVDSLSAVVTALLGLASLGAVLYETYTLLKDRATSRRFGDHRAGTRIVELDD